MLNNVKFKRCGYLTKKDGKDEGKVTEASVVFPETGQRVRAIRRSEINRLNQKLVIQPGNEGTVEEVEECVCGWSFVFIRFDKDKNPQGNRSAFWLGQDPSQWPIEVIGEI